MIFTSETLLNFASALAFIVVLTMAYGHVQRRSLSRNTGETVLGFCFGLVALLQMNTPLEPMPGLIIDLRNVPLVLCGAFLGWRGMLACFGVAAAMRFSIGGIGLWSALLAMCIALGAGSLWRNAVQRVKMRGVTGAVLLSVMASAHLGAAVILPDPMRAWFFANAALPISVLNLVSITIAAYLLGAEQRKIEREARLASAAREDPDHGAMTKPAFEREIALRVASGDMTAPAGLMVVRVRRFQVLQDLIPSDWQGTILGLVRTRLSQMFKHADIVCALDNTRLMFAIDSTQMLEAEALKGNAQRLVSKDAFVFPGNLRKSVMVSARIYPWQNGENIEAATASSRGAQNIGPRRSSKKAITFDQSRALATHGGPIGSELSQSDQPVVDGLFGKAAILMQDEGIYWDPHLYARAQERALWQRGN